MALNDVRHLLQKWKAEGKDYPLAGMASPTAAETQRFVDALKVCRVWDASSTPASCLASGQRHPSLWHRPASALTASLLQAGGLKVLCNSSSS